MSMTLPKYKEKLGVTFLFLDHPGLTGTNQIEKFQEKAQMELQDYVQKTYSEDTYRWSTGPCLTQKGEGRGGVGCVAGSDSSNLAEPPFDHWHLQV